MEKTDIAIIIFTVVLFTGYFLFKGKFPKVLVILYVLLSIYIGIVSYNGYQAVVDLYIKIEHGSPSAVPELVESIYMTFGLFAIYSFINIILLSLFYKRQLKQINNK